MDLSGAVEQLSEMQDLLATLMESKKCLQKELSGTDLPGDEGALGAEVNRGIEAVGTQAQIGKTGEGKGSRQDLTRVGNVRCRRWFCCGHRRFLLLFFLVLYGV